jgi:hypothetical protein
MLWVLANNPKATLAADDFAIAADLFDRSADFHKVSNNFTGHDAR